MALTLSGSCSGVPTRADQGREAGARNTDSAMSAEDLISVRDLAKSYNAHPAVRGVTFSVRAGESFGLLGPNGAGKTTGGRGLPLARARRRGGSLRLVDARRQLFTVQLEQNLALTGPTVTTASLRAQLRAHADPKNAAGAQRFFAGGVKTYGVHRERLDAMTRDAVAALRKTGGLPVALRIGDGLYRSGNMDEAALAARIVARFQRALEPSHFATCTSRLVLRYACELLPTAKRARVLKTR